jgi:hypothetical protein
MAKCTSQFHPIEIPEELHASAKTFIERAFTFFAEQTKQFTEDIIQFNKKRGEVQRKIRDGTRRTSGRII